VVVRHTHEATRKSVPNSQRNSHPGAVNCTHGSGLYSGTYSCPFGGDNAGQDLFYTRERTSYNALKTVLPERCTLHTDHDTALHLEASDLPRADVRSRGHTFYAIRNDKESRSIARQRKPFRMWFDPVPYSSFFDEWVGHHARASAVVANRLHSAVVSTILGKPTVLLPNSYHKNRSVYEFSLADRRVEWREEIDTTSLDQFLSYLPARMRNSTRLASGLMAVAG